MVLLFLQTQMISKSNIMNLYVILESLAKLKVILQYFLADPHGLSSIRPKSVYSAICLETCCKIVPQDKYK